MCLNLTQKLFKLKIGTTGVPSNILKDVFDSVTKSDTYLISFHVGVFNPSLGMGK